MVQGYMFTLYNYRYFQWMYNSNVTYHFTKFSSTMHREDQSKHMRQDQVSKATGEHNTLPGVKGQTSISTDLREPHSSPQPHHSPLWHRHQRQGTWSWSPPWPGGSPAEWPGPPQLPCLHSLTYFKLVRIFSVVTTDASVMVARLQELPLPFSVWFYLTWAYISYINNKNNLSMDKCVLQ